MTVVVISPEIKIYHLLHRVSSYWLFVPLPQKQTGEVPCPRPIKLGDSVYMQT